MNRKDKTLLSEELLERQSETNTDTRILNEYERIGLETGSIVAEKNAAYGEAVRRTAEALKIFFPNGIPPERYIDILMIVRIFDKISRIAVNNDPFGESPWRDIMGYGLLGVYYLTH